MVNKLGQAWANKAGSEQFKYFMVFDKNPLEGAYYNGLTKYENICINEQEVVCSALKYYASLNLDFVDCLLLSYHSIKKFQVATFDDKLRKHLERIHNNER